VTKLPLPLFLDELDSPLGRLAIVVDAAGRLHALGWLDRHDRMGDQMRAWGPRLSRGVDPSGVSSALRAYFAGDLQAIDALPVGFEGTLFQNAVWRALREIPCGETRSYGQLARAIGKPAAVRAVGLANGANPVGIVVPCHRVIGADGSLTGYGGGLERKRWLLAHERRDLPLFRASGPAL